MWDIWSGVEELVDAMAAVRLHNLAASTLGNFFDGVTVVSEKRAWFHELDGFLETRTCGFDHADIVWILRCGVADIVCFVQIAVEATMIERDVDVQNIAIL